MRPPHVFVFVFVSFACLLVSTTGKGQSSVYLPVVERSDATSTPEPTMIPPFATSDPVPSLTPTPGPFDCVRRQVMALDISPETVDDTIDELAIGEVCNGTNNFVGGLNVHFLVYDGQGAEIGRYGILYDYSLAPNQRYCFSRLVFTPPTTSHYRTNAAAYHIAGTNYRDLRVSQLTYTPSSDDSPGGIISGIIGNYGQDSARADFAVSVYGSDGRLMDCQHAYHENLNSGESVVMSVTTLVEPHTYRAAVGVRR